MIEKKRSTGITVAALLVMASGVVGLSSSLPAQSTVSIFIKPLGILIFTLSVLLSFAEIVLASVLLRLKEWARASLTAVMLVNIVVLLFSPFFYTPTYLQSQAAILKSDLDKTHLLQEKRIVQMRSSFDEKIKGYSAQEQERLRQAFDSSLNDLPQLMLRMSMFLVGACAFIWYVGVIYFFTRPKVVAQFE